MTDQSHRISQFSTIFSFLLLSLLIVFSGTSRADAPLWRIALDNATRPVYSGRIIVKFKDKALPSLKNLDVSNAGLEVVKELKNIGLSVLEVKDKAIMHTQQAQIQNTVDERVIDLNKSSSIEYAEPDYLLYIDNMPNDPQFGDLWGLHNTGQTSGTFDADIDAPEAWDLNTQEILILLWLLSIQVWITTMRILLPTCGKIQAR